MGLPAMGHMGTERCPDLKWLLRPDYLSSPETTASLWKELAPSCKKYDLGEPPPCGLGGGNGITEKIQDSHPLSQTHPFPALSQTKTHTPNPGHHPRATATGPLTCGHPQIFPSQAGLHLGTQPALGGGYVYSKDPESNSSWLTVFGRVGGGRLSTVFPPSLSMAQGALPLLPPGAREQRPNPRARV